MSVTVSRQQRSQRAVLGAYVALALAASVIAVSGLTGGADAGDDVAGSSQAQQSRS